MSRAFLELVKSSDANGIYNVGSGIATRNIDMAEILQAFLQDPPKDKSEHLESAGGINRNPVNVNASSNIPIAAARVANIEKITSETNWRPKVDLEEGVHEFLRFRSL